MPKSLVQTDGTLSLDLMMIMIMIVRMIDIFIQGGTLLVLQKLLSVRALFKIRSKDNLKSKLIHTPRKVFNFFDSHR